jgi:hypothetical protein
MKCPHGLLHTRHKSHSVLSVSGRREEGAQIAHGTCKYGRGGGRWGGRGAKKGRAIRGEK